MDDLARLIEAVQASAKYRAIAPSLIEAVGRDELAKGRRFKDAVKATKNKLHQVAGAYFPDRPPYDRWLADLAAAAPDPVQQRSVLRAIMAQHASTRERLPILDDFYATALAGLPPLHSVLDLACGLNPLAWSWLPLAPDAVYYACDIYQDQMDFLAAALTQCGVRNQCRVCNVLEDLPRVRADVALLLKTLPCLEQLDKQIGPRLLDAIDAPVVLVSYPVHSLGGRSKGMAANYAEQFAALAADRPWRVQRFDFPTELLFRIERD